MNTQRLTPEQVLLTDEISNEKYVGFYAERKLSRLVITAGTVLLLGSFGVIGSLARRPVQTRYIRIDEIGKATAIQYSDRPTLLVRVKSAPTSPTGPTTATPSTARRSRRSTP